MTCERYREAASARLDGAPIGLSASALDEHLARCADCAAWLAAAIRIGRAYRVSGTTPPDLSEAILDAVVSPAARLGRYRRRLRLGLLVLGFVQWALAVPALFGDNVGMQMGMHASHEGAAWTLALGASFIAVAIKPVRAVGTLPILATFVLVLSAFTIPDVAAGQVDAARLTSHVGVLLGLLLVSLMSRSQPLLSPYLGSGLRDSAPRAEQGPARHPFGRDRGAA